jgi:hypothetical protein
MAPQRLRFLLQGSPGFTPPPSVANLQNHVDIDLLLGAQLLWTNICGRGDSVGYGVVQDWEAMTVPGKSPHQFQGSSLGDETEISGGDGGKFAKVVSLAFMSEYAGATWYKVLKPIWGETLKTGSGDISITKKDPNEDGPDYLVAPFDPSSTALGGPLYALEIKGRKDKVEFNHVAFSEFSSQARNISLSNTSDGTPVNLKSWVSVFNYGFEQPRGSREESTLLVQDPDIAPGAPNLDAKALNGATIIREHLARQCLLLGGHALRVPVLMGRALEGARSLPLVYKINHPALSARRYIGQWFSFLPSGDLTPLPVTRWHARRHGPHRAFFASHDGRAEIFFHDDGTGPIGWIAEMLGLSDIVFVGQDATMLRRCTQVSLGKALDGAPFEDELQLFKPSGDDGKILRLTRSGSVIASSRLVELDSDEFWSKIDKS